MEYTFLPVRSEILLCHLTNLTVGPRTQNLASFEDLLCSIPLVE